jgi:hypothetical protein
MTTGGPSWRLKGAMAPPTQLKFTQYYLVFISFDHVKYKIFQISPLNFYIMTFGPSYNDGQGPPLTMTNVMSKKLGTKVAIIYLNHKYYNISFIDLSTFTELSLVFSFQVNNCTNDSVFG